MRPKWWSPKTASTPKSTTTTSMKYRQRKFRGEPRLPKEPELPSGFCSRETVEMKPVIVKYEVIVHGDKGRVSRFYFRGKKAAQQAFDCANRNMLEHGYAVHTKVHFCDR